MIHGFKNSTLPASPTEQPPRYGHRPQLSRYPNLAKHLSFQPISLWSVSYNLFELLLLRRLEPVFDPQLRDKQAGFRHSQCITDQVFKLRFEEINTSGIVLADLIAAHNTLLCGTKTKRSTTAYDLQLLLWTKFSELVKN